MDVSDTTNQNILSLRLERGDLPMILEECRKNKELIDVQLRIGDQLFDAHRLVLSAYSPVLKPMLSDQWSTTKICPISGEYVDPSIVEELLHFLYTGSIDLTPDNVHPVCVAAHFLQIATLLEPAVQHLCRLISVENALTLFEFSLNSQLERLRVSCLQFIERNNAQVFQNSNILKFTVESFKSLIAGLKEQYWNPNKQLRVNTFDCIVRWTEVNLSERLNELPGLLKSIPLEELPHDFLTGTVSTHPLVKSATSCPQTVSAALENYQTVLKSGWRTSQNLLIFGNEKDDNQKNNRVRCYDWLNETGRVLPDMHQPRHTGQYKTINGRDIVVSGGYYCKGEAIKKLNSIEMFTWASQTWKKLTNLPGRAGRDYYSIGTLNGNLYAAALELQEWDPRRNQMINEPLHFYGYSFQTRKWKPLRPLNVRRTSFSLVGCGNHLYAFGGGTNVVEKYDPATDQWSDLEQTGIDPKVWEAAVHQGKIYTCGENGDLLMFDPETGVWSLIAKYYHPFSDNLSIRYRRFRNLVSLNDQLLAIDPDGDISKFDFSKREWRKFCEMNTNFTPSHMIVGEFH